MSKIVLPFLISKGAENGFFGSILPMSMVGIVSFHFSRAATTAGKTVAVASKKEKNKETAIARG